MRPEGNFKKSFTGTLAAEEETEKEVCALAPLKNGGELIPLVKAGRKLR